MSEKEGGATNGFRRARKFYRETVAPVMEFSSRSRFDILESLAKGKKVLDLGCVDHAIIEGHTDSEWFLHGRLVRSAESVKGLDYEGESIRVLRERGFDVVQGNAENFDLGEKYDMVVAGEIIEHLTNHRGVLDSVRRHLREDGEIVMSVPNSGALFYVFGTLLFGHETDSWDHTCMFTPITFCVLLRKCGFRAKRIILNQPGFGNMYHHSALWMKILGITNNIIHRFACLLRMNFAKTLIVVAEPVDKEN